jgi:hypothetical protein
MRVTASWTRKDGRQDYGSEGAQITLTIEVPDDCWLDPAKHAELMRQARELTTQCRRTVEEELHAAAVRGRAAKEAESAAAAKRDEERRAAEETQRRESGRRDEPEPEHRNGNGRPRYAEGNYNQATGEVDYDYESDDAPPARDDRRPRDREPEPRRDDRPSRRDDRAGSRDAGKPPRNGRQLAAWVRDQPKEVEDRIKRLMKSENLGWRYVELREDDVQWLYEQTFKPESRSHAMNGNGRH